MPPADRFVSETYFPVRYAETDAMGIVHHASYVVYFEAARVHYAQARGAPYEDLIELGYYLTVAEVHARYAVPARFGQIVAARCWVEEARSRSITFGYEIADSKTEVVHVTGQTRHICINHSEQVARLPDAWLQALRG
jgi:acyl-CoA thioester hydrolase